MRFDVTFLCLFDRICRREFYIIWFERPRDPSSLEEFVCHLGKDLVPLASEASALMVGERLHQ